MDVEIRTPAESSADFKRSLHRFLETRDFAGGEGFTIHWAEPQGAEVIQHVRFETQEVAEAFQISWQGDVFDRD